jgi:hypothetical protein
MAENSDTPETILFSDIEEEYRKCIESPYYFATKYLKLTHAKKTINFSTPLTEESFNEMFKFFSHGK